MSEATVGTVPEILVRSANSYPDQIAIACEGREIRYSELLDRSRRMANALVALGIRPGDRVAWLGRSSEAWYEIFMGAAMARAVLTPINARLAEAEVAYILDDSTAEILFVTPDYADLAQRAIGVAERTIRLVILTPGQPACLSLDVGSDAIADTPPRDWQPDDHVIMIYTSGTTGRPKGVCITNRNYAAFANLRLAVEGFAYKPGDVVLILVSLFHVAGCNMALASLASGAKALLHPEFSPAEVARAVRDERVDHVFLAPVMIGAVLAMPNIEAQDFSSLQTISYGSSAITEALLARATETFGCDFIQFYGISETLGSGTSLSPENHDPAHLQSCGKAWPGLEVRIASASGDPLAPGEVGEIEIRGDVVMDGYWRKAESTAETIRPDGWLRTGDAGYIDEDGFVYIRDRIKDMIVTGGENVYPIEVENAIADCPGVAEVAVVGAPDDRWGEAVTAVIVRHSGHTLSGEDVIAWARGKIAGYKLPKRVDFVEALPRNPTGKILKRTLRDAYWAGRDRQVN